MNRVEVAGDPRLSLLQHGPDTGPRVLLVHGTTFPSALAAGYRFDGRSWMDDLAEAGFDVWALDFAGYGESARYPETDGPPLGRVPVAAEQLARAVELICQRRGIERLSLVAHSWGSLVAGRYAGNHGDRVERLVLFGAIARREEVTSIPSFPAYLDVTLDAQHARFVEDVPEGEPPVLEDFDAWGEAYLATDPDAVERTPPAVRIPAGPLADIMSAWAGYFPYEPAAIGAPALVVRGEWDSLCRDDDSAWLRARLGCGEEVIPRGTHLLHLETGRHALHEATRRFLLA